MEGEAGTHTRHPRPRQDSLRLHASDPRPIAYTAGELEGARTHDDLWNAAQLQMTTRGKMHGFLRMYWAKKILECVAPTANGVGCGCWLHVTDPCCARCVLRVVQVVAEPCRGVATRHLPQRQVQPGRPRPQRLRGLHVVHRGHPRHGVRAALCARDRCTTNVL